MSLRAGTNGRADPTDPLRLAPRRRRPARADIRRILGAVVGAGPYIVVQPVVTLSTGTVSGYEALARFTRLPGASPQDWFAAAHRAGLGPSLESLTVAAALMLGERRPPDTILSLNVSPNVAGTAEFQAVLPEDLTGLQFEVTEDQLAGDTGAVLAALDGLRHRGGRIAVDDIGAGYAGFRRLMAISPDVVKLNRALVSGAAAGPRKRALIEAIVHFSDRTGAQVCAEGIETLDDLAVMAELGVTYGQGWLLGRPAAEFTAPAFPRHAGGPAARAPDVIDVMERIAAAEDIASIRATLAGAAATLGCADIRLVIGTAGPVGPDERAFPLVGGGRPVGALVCVNCWHWTAALERMARALATVAGPAIAAL